MNSQDYFVQSEWGQHWKLCEVLNARKAAGNSTRASCASFGPNRQYYLGFDDLIYYKIDDPDIGKIVKENLVKFASFGPKGAVIVVLKSGAYYFRGWDRFLVHSWHGVQKVAIGTPRQKVIFSRV